MKYPDRRLYGAPKYSNALHWIWTNAIMESVTVLPHLEKSRITLWPIPSRGFVLAWYPLIFCQHQIRVHFSWPWCCPWTFPSPWEFCYSSCRQSLQKLYIFCKKHYVDILIEELGLHSLPGNPTYNLTDFSASEVLDNHKLVLTSFGIQTNNEELDLPYIYWIPKMHKNPYKHRFITGSSKCSTKPFSILLTKLLTHIKQGLKKYCETAYSRSGINQIWILKNSKELLDHLKSPNFNLITNIKSFHFSTLYPTIPHQKLKIRLATIIRNSFIHKNGNRRYKYLVLGREGPYFVREHSDSKSKYTEEDIIRMLEFIVDNIFVVFAGKVFQQIIGIPMGTNCAPFLADIFLYSYEAEFIHSLLSTGRKRLASQFNFTYIQIHRWRVVH